jgi:hypothetical protein
MPHIRVLLPLCVAALLLTGCIFGHGDPVPSDLRPKGVLIIVPGVGDGPGVSIDDAASHSGADPVLVNGVLFVDHPDGPVRLCDTIAESFPPQCGGSWLEVRGLDLSTVPGLQNANGVRWAELVQLLGRLQEG